MKPGKATAILIVALIAIMSSVKSPTLTPPSVHDSFNEILDTIAFRVAGSDAVDCGMLVRGLIETPDSNVTRCAVDLLLNRKPFVARFVTGARDTAFLSWFVGTADGQLYQISSTYYANGNSYDPPKTILCNQYSLDAFVEG